MHTDADLVWLCAAIYVPQPTGFWDYFQDGSAPDGICAGVKDNALICRGSITREDWVRDLEVIRFGSIRLHPQFGKVHAGMDEGLDEFFEKVAPHLSDGACFSGHSLGAAHAWGLAGRYVLAGGSPGRITVVGSPRYGCIEFCRFIAPYPKASFRNGEDPVTEVPFVIGDELALGPAIPQPILVEPTDWSEGLMAWHSIALYNQGVTALKKV